MLQIIVGALISYLLGSIPSAYIFGKIYKSIDIREHGSGNVGATNVFRVLGKWPGVIVLLCDILKGIIAVAIVPDVLSMSDVLVRIVMAISVVVGHNWTVFLSFKGGKGIATSLGVLIGLTIKIAVIRPVLLWTLLIWVICFLLTSIVSFSSVIAATSLPVIMVITDQEFKIVFLGVIFCVFVVLRHRPNIKRLFVGKEPKVPSIFKKK